MPNSLIATKLHGPRPRPDIISRDRLHALMDRGARSRVTLISAPAGFGKTTLLVDWLATRKGSPHGIAWVSLDTGDNEPAIFWGHLIAAVRDAVLKLGDEMPPFSSPDQPADRRMTVSLLNALAALEGELDVILDDFHVIEDLALFEELAFFVDHLSDNVHLIISTRADPLLPLARLRARGELTEVRSADLRFRADEAASYFAASARIALDPADVAKLEQRTEGWIAALQLAALSLRGRSDPSRFVADFAGSDRYVVDFLFEEVLLRQPADVQQFLYATALLGRFNADLCDTILETSGSGAMIQALEQQNLFVVPLDDRRGWYRYHHLFADVLMAHMPKAEHDRLSERHRRASLWFEEHQYREEAIRHALAAPDFELAAQLIERAIPEMRLHRRVSMLRSSIEALPDALVRARPVLNVNLVGSLLTAGVTEGVEIRLSEAEEQMRGLETPAARGLIAGIEVFRSGLAQMRGDMPAAVDHARRVFEVAPPQAGLERAGAAGFLAIVAWSQGDLEAAQDNWRQCSEGLLRVGYVADALNTLYAQGQIALAQGKLDDAEIVLRRGIALAAERQGYPLPGAADLHVGLGEVLFERGDVAGARSLLAQSDSPELAGMPQYPARRLAVEARIACSEEDYVEAKALLDEAERLHVADFFPISRPIGAIRARISIRQRDWVAVERWQRETKVTVDQPPSYSSEYEQVTLVRMLLAKKDARAAMLLADRLQRFAEKGGRYAVVTELAVLRSLALGAMDQTVSAQSAMRAALDSAESNGQVRVFLDDGETITDMLRDAAKGRAGSAFARRLLALLGAPQSSPRPVEHADLLEPLSERELDVLRLLRGELSGPDIASELRVSLNTVRTHTKNIYDKLAVNSRRAAVRRAEELNLLGRARTA